MTFGAFIRKRRKQLQLTQKQVLGFDQGTISKTENGQNPTKREIVYDLAVALKLPTDDEYIDWLWMYSMLDRVPYERHQNQEHRASQALTVYDNANQYHTEPANAEEVSVELNATEEEVLSILGPPDKRMRIPSRIKWIYQAEGLHIVFAGGHVVDVMFK